MGMKYFASLFLLLVLGCSEPSLSLAEDEIAIATLSQDEIELYDALLEFATESIKNNGADHLQRWKNQMAKQDSMSMFFGGFDIPWTMEEQKQLFEQLDTTGLNLFAVRWMVIGLSTDTLDKYCLSRESNVVKMWNKAAETNSTWYEIMDAYYAVGEFPPHIMTLLFSSRNPLIDDPKMRLLLSLLYMEKV